MSIQMLRYLGATCGAYSTVTATEANHDRSVTLDQHEKNILNNFLPLEDIPRQHAAMEGIPFLVLAGNIEAERHLIIKYPKPEGNELRLYMGNERGFSGQAGEQFVIFRRAREPYPVVGFLAQANFDIIEAGDHEARPEDEIAVDMFAGAEGQLDIQRAIGHLRDPRLEMRLIYSRSIEQAVIALERADYLCEINPRHQTFVSRVSGRQFVEAHHLMPVSRAAYFTYNLDVHQNIVALCPNCHRNIHHGTLENKRALIDHIYTQRVNLLRHNGLLFTLGDLFVAYGV
ncbi:HNH endonuclease [Falsirhodobacter sp. alg1]|uniref:HNH endonuclease n=2 Tax=Falsirhodobacter sp. alg1 TaxID=1472418 RepID=UPI001EDC4358|nr:HNH endonuclease [Falsirhodobacter sp. alg1]